jgi:hypothetical protein
MRTERPSCCSRIERYRTAPSPMNTIERSFVSCQASSTRSGGAAIGRINSRPVSSYSEPKISPRCPSIHAATNSPAAWVPSDRASASSVGTGTTLRRRATASPCTVAIPTRSPVNDPGPAATANRSRSLMLRCAASSAAARSPGRRWPCVSDASPYRSARTDPSRTTATLPARVVVSRARMCNGLNVILAAVRSSGSLERQVIASTRTAAVFRPRRTSGPL